MKRRREGSKKFDLIEFHSFQLRDLDIGGQFPDIKNLRVHNVELHDEGFIENLDLILNLHYEGNFRMAIEADMLLGKKGFLSVIGEQMQSVTNKLG